MIWTTIPEISTSFVERFWDFNEYYTFSALTLLVGGRKGIRPVKNMGGWWRWALVSPDGVALSRMVGVSASVNLPLHHKVQKFSSGTGLPGSSREKGRKTVVCIYLPSFERVALAVLSL